MNSRQENKLTMMMVFRDFLLGNTIITDNWPSFAELFASMVNYIQQILVLANKQGVDIKGFAKAKTRMRADMTIRAMSLVGKMHAYATIIEDDVLKQKLSISKSELDGMPDTVVAAKCNEIANMADALKEAVENYGIKPIMISELVTLVESYTAAVPTTKTAIKDKKQVTEDTDALFDSCDKVIGKIDALAEMERYEKPQFYSSYWSSRKTEDTGRRTRALQFYVYDSEAGSPVVKAKVMARKKGGSELSKSVKRTSTMGGFWMNNAAAGEYEYEVTMGGYVTATGSYFINDGVMTEVEVKLVKS
jgi:hypothetical protein